MRRVFHSILFTVLAAVSTSLLAGPERVVAVGDIHGEYEGFVAILEQAGLIDQKLRWSGGSATFVQTGDFLDRGADVRRVMDLLMALERGTRRGRVVILLGNHELMNLTSILQDLNPAQYAAFTDRRSQSRREAGYRDYVALNERLAKRYPGAQRKIVSETEWMDAHPPGFIEYAAALGRDGKYGRWLRTRPIMAKIGDSVFMHAGINPRAPVQTIDKINAQVRLEIEAFDRIREYLVAQKLILPFANFEEISEVAKLESSRPEEDLSKDMRRVTTVFSAVQYWSILHYDGPLWFRGFADWTDEQGEREMPVLLERFGARRFVVGHSIPPDGHILPRFGGKVFLIDTAMLRGLTKTGRPSALEIDGDSVSAIYQTGRVSLTTSRSLPYLIASLSGDLPRAEHVWLGPNATPLPFRTAEEVANFLRGAKVVKIERKKLAGVTKPQKVLVEKGGVRVNAVFRSLHREEENAKWESGVFTEFLRDTYRSEIAAYELSLLLGLDTVPPTVAWQMGRRPGSLQMWIEKAEWGYHPDELRKPPDPERWQMERERMRPFDALIANGDRHPGNILVDSTRKVWWIDHSRAFLRERDLIEPDLIRRCERGFYERLKAVDPKTVAERMIAYMSQREIDALLDRRLKLIALIEERIAAAGEPEVLFTVEP